MKKLSLALALLLFGSAASFAAITRNVQGYELDSTKPGLKQNKQIDLDFFPTRTTTAYNLGTVTSTSTGVVATEYGVGAVHQTLFTITSQSVTTTDAGAAGSQGGVQLYDWPQGLILMLGASSDLAITAGAGGIADGAAVVCSVGEVVAAVDNATLTSTEANVIASTAATLTAGVGACDGDGTTALIAILNGSATAKDVFLNFAVPDADSSASDTISVTGTVTVTWVDLGDN